MYLLGAKSQKENCKNTYADLIHTLINSFVYFSAAFECAFVSHMGEIRGYDLGVDL